MTTGKAVGPLASVRKYDLITGLGCRALKQGGHAQRLTLRFITLVTARYNWRRDELSVGRREIARLWHVDERTVKREMAKLKAIHWLSVKHAGVRGRVTIYALGHEAIDEATRGIWSAVGPDFEARMNLAEDTGQGAEIVPMPGAGLPVTGMNPDGTEWSFAAAALATDAPHLYRAWFQALRRKGREGERLTLIAPSAFHQHHVQAHHTERLLATINSIEPEINAIRIITE